MSKTVLELKNKSRIRIHLNDSGAKSNDYLNPNKFHFCLFDCFIDCLIVRMFVLLIS